MIIVLIGFMACGKSTTAQHLSKLLHLPLLDMDALVLQKTASADMHELFAKGGELLLRKTEIELAQELASQTSFILSTGGGVVLNKIILDYFRDKGAKIFFLDTPFEEIIRRLENEKDTRPLFQNRADLQNLYHFRLPLYRLYANTTIDCNKLSPEQIALAIQKIVVQQGASHAL